MSAQFDAAMTQVINDLNAANLVAHTDAATAAQLLAGAQASDTADKALVVQLTAVLKAKGFNPDGTPIVTTPPPSKTVKAVDAGSGNVDVSWAGYTPSIVGRTGQDSGGYPADSSGWNTGLRTPPGLTAAEVAAKTVRFSGMATGVAVTYSANEADGTAHTATLTVAKPAGTGGTTPPPTGSFGPFKMGFFQYQSLPDVFTNLLQHDCPVGHTFIDVSNDFADPLALQQYTPWLKARADRRVIVSVQPNASDFDGPTILANCRTLARKIHSLGIESQVFVEWGPECNANWFGWGSAASGNGSGARWKVGYRQCVLAMRAEAPGLTFGFNAEPAVPGSGPDVTNWYPGDDVVDYVSPDVYLWGLYGSTQQKFQTWRDAPFGSSQGPAWFRAFANTHNKGMAITEWGVTNLNTPVGGGSGDDPDLLELAVRWMIANVWTAAYEDVEDGSVNTTLEKNPNCLSRLRSILASL